MTIERGRAKTLSVTNGGGEELAFGGLEFASFARKSSGLPSQSASRTASSAAAAAPRLNRHARCAYSKRIASHMRLPCRFTARSPVKQPCSPNVAAPRNGARPMRSWKRFATVGA